jgi:hypothetical protein
MTVCLGAVVVLSTGRGDVVVVIVRGADMREGEINGRWYAGGGGLAVVVLITVRGDVVVAVV